MAAASGRTEPLMGARRFPLRCLPAKTLERISGSAQSYGRCEAKVEVAGNENRNSAKASEAAPTMIRAEEIWKPASGRLWLAGGEIHFFRASLDQAQDRIQDLAGNLSSDECERAQRFRHERDGQRFIAGRGQLREILGAMLEIEPGVFSFEYGPFGKPRIGTPASGRSLHFNLAHAGALAVYAIASEEIGLDMECVRPVSEAESIAERFFTRDEAARLRVLAEDERTQTFFTFWTRKEALIKALGVTFDDVRLAKENCVVRDDAMRPSPATANESPTAPWILQSFQPAAGYVGAFATQIPEPCLFWWNWP